MSERFGVRLVYHTGSIDGFRAGYVRIPSLNALGIFLSNNESVRLDALRRATTKALLGDPEECGEQPH